MIGLNFKNITHVDHYHKIHSKLAEVVNFTAKTAWCDFRTRLEVTSIYRDGGGVHGVYRGIDLVPVGRSIDIMEALRNLINCTFDYGKEGLEVCPDIYHGTAPHLHLQVRDSTLRKRYEEEMVD